MSTRYAPGQRHLLLSGEFVRYYKAAEENFIKEGVTTDRDLIFSFAEHAFFADLEAAVEMDTFYKQHYFLMLAGDDDPDEPEEDTTPQEDQTPPYAATVEQILLDIVDSLKRPNAK